ncbi:FAD/FMN-dependent dehydrogenase [Actinobacteria bacterium IMCC26207]|nr:FAD/FMN-dependent dehydrogenase [Actinobacteria bacterium IMCC26207]
MATLTEQLAELIPGDRVLRSELSADYGSDECLTVEAVAPAVVVCPESTEEVSAILEFADKNLVAVTARGAGTGLSGAAVPTPESIVISFERMNKVLEIDTENHVAVVQPGVRLNELDLLTREHNLMYPVYPGEYSSTLGGNISTNAGGMRAVKYGVTRHQVLGVELVLAGGEVLRSGGKFVKASTGYDLTQLVVGSEGTLALVTEATLKLSPRIEHQMTVLAPFSTLDQVSAAVPRVVDSGIGPVVLEYIDLLTMSAVHSYTGLELGIPQEIQDTALAYLVVMMENPVLSRLEEDTERLSEMLFELGAIDAYVLPAGAASGLIDAREKAFWMAKAAGADDIIDIVVPRAQIPLFMERVAALAGEYDAWIAGCGHAGDGNVHMGIFCSDSERRHRLLTELFAAGLALGGAISGEHGVGRAKKQFFNELVDPAKIALMRRIKSAFDPNGILNPEILFNTEDQS